LPQEKELREDADGFEDYGEYPEDFNNTPFILLPENQHHKRSQHRRSHQTRASKLPSLLPLPRPRIYPHHQEDNIQTTQNIKYLEHEVPPGIDLEEVQVAGYEDQTVEGLRYEGDAFGARVAVDRVD